MTRGRQVTLALSGTAFAVLAGAMATAAHSTSSPAAPASDAGQSTTTTTPAVDPFDEQVPAYTQPPFSARPAPSPQQQPQQQRQVPDTQSSGS